MTKSAETMLTSEKSAKVIPTYATKREGVSVWVDTSHIITAATKVTTDPRKPLEEIIERVGGINLNTRQAASNADGKEN
jgi:hypothetical protein